MRARGYERNQAVTLIALVLVMVGGLGCAVRPPVSHPTHEDSLVHDSTRHASGVPLPPAEGDPRTPWSQEGTASWYGSKFHGRTTANGEVYDMHGLSAAHRSLPFGTVVEVTNLANGSRVQVRVNDRGPFVEDRIIDLSLGAARALDFVNDGITPVRVVVLSGGESMDEGVTDEGGQGTGGGAGAGNLVVGRYDSWWKADRLQRFLQGRFSTVRIEGVEGDYRVVIGPFSSERLRRSVAGRLSLEGYDVEMD